jgi:hypothetical protein
MTASYEIRRLTVDTSSWTAVVVPIDCTRVYIKQSDATNNFKVASDSAGVNVGVPVEPSDHHYMEAATGSFAPCFSAGSTVCYVQAVGGTGPLVVESIR